MKAKVIREVLRKKIGEWIATVEDESLRDLLKKNVIVTGGAIASMLMNEPVNDYDVYFATRECAFRVASYYVARFQPGKRNGIDCGITVVESGDRIEVKIQSSGIASEGGTDKPYEYFEAREDGAAAEYVGAVMEDEGAIIDKTSEIKNRVHQEQAEERDYRPVFMSTNAITLSGKIQVVLRFFGEADKIHENYDYVHCTNYWTTKDDELVLRPAALESLITKELRYVGSKYPICSLIRIRKFVRRGWTINAGQILKMAMQVNKLDLNDINVLRDQLTGVDAAYFCELITKLKEKDPQKVNCAYLIEIIDRMF